MSEIEQDVLDEIFAECIRPSKTASEAMQRWLEHPHRPIGGVPAIKECIFIAKHFEGSPALDDRGLEQAEAIVHWARHESFIIYDNLGKREIEHALEALRKARELA